MTANEQLTIKLCLSFAPIGGILEYESLLKLHFWSCKALCIIYLFIYFKLTVNLHQTHKTHKLTHFAENSIAIMQLGHIQ